MSATKTAKQEISARYRAYCEVCWSGQLDSLPGFWSLPAMFTLDVGGGEPIHRIIESASALQDMYAVQFRKAADSASVTENAIEDEEITLYGEHCATIRTRLRHSSKGIITDKLYALYGARKDENGLWMFISLISNVEKNE